LSVMSCTTTFLVDLLQQSIGSLLTSDRFTDIHPLCYLYSCADFSNLYHCLLSRLLCSICLSVKLFHLFPFYIFDVCFMSFVGLMTTSIITFAQLVVCLKCDVLLCFFAFCTYCVYPY